MIESKERVPMTDNEKLVYAAAFAASLQKDSIPTVAARFAASAVYAMRQAEGFLGLLEAGELNQLTLPRQVIGLQQAFPTNLSVRKMIEEMNEPSAPIAPIEPRAFILVPDDIESIQETLRRCGCTDPVVTKAF